MLIITYCPKCAKTYAASMDVEKLSAELLDSPQCIDCFTDTLHAPPGTIDWIILRLKELPIALTSAWFKNEIIP